jgi:YfiH family protein
MSHESGTISNAAGDVVARWIFTDRHDGYGHEPYDTCNLASHVGDAQLAVAANRSKFAEWLGTDKITWPGLVHSTDVGVVDSDISLFPNVDVLMTTRKRHGLATMGADCVPLVAVETNKRIALTAHVGWRGAADDIIDSIKEALTELGGDVRHLHVLLGPSICGNCYQCDADRIQSVCSVLPEAKSDDGDGIDIRKGLAAAFKRLGCTVELVGGCTAEDARYFSHRRDGVTGRQGAGVVLA